jgi:hypothetical protein
VADVFISYSKVDRAIAESLANDLKARGFEVWWDFELYAGDNFQSMIRAEISKAKAVVVIWSDTAAVSEWVYGEAMLASRRGTMISAHVPGFDVHEVPINFLPLHCEPVTNRDRLIGAIERKGGKRKIAAPKSAPIDESTQLDELRMDELRARATTGAAQAQYRLGYGHLDDRTTHRSDEETARLWGLSAARDARAQFNLGVMYANGRGVAKNEVEAVRLYRLAADQGHMDAQCNLGWMCENGRGTAQDDMEAVRHYRLAAEAGNFRAQLNLGLMYENGYGVAQDDVEAARLYRLAAEQGNAAAQLALGSLYEEGLGVAKDQQEAMRLYQLAAEQSDEDANKALAQRGVGMSKLPTAQ